MKRFALTLIAMASVCSAHASDLTVNVDRRFTVTLSAGFDDYVSTPVAPAIFSASLSHTLYVIKKLAIERDRNGSISLYTITQNLSNAEVQAEHISRLTSDWGDYYHGEMADTIVSTSAMPATIANLPALITKFTGSKYEMSNVTLFFGDGQAISITLAFNGIYRSLSVTELNELIESITLLK